MRLKAMGSKEFLYKLEEKANEKGSSSARVLFFLLHAHKLGEIYGAGFGIIFSCQKIVFVLHGLDRCFLIFRNNFSKFKNPK